ncbi:MAG: tetratricopeptide repeat protein [Promethearchaeota archaeon]|jgi:tetratricopeptide (TPR) repeat protein
MLESTSKELIKIEKLVNEAQYQEAKELLAKFEKKNDISSEDKITCLNLKANLYRIMGRYEDAINLTENAYNMSKSIENIQQMFDSLILKIEVMRDNLMFEEPHELAKQLEIIFHSLKNISPAELMKKEADLDYIMGMCYSDNHEFKLAEEYLKKSLSLREKIGDKAKIAQSLLWLGGIFDHKGDLIHSQNYYEQSLAVDEIYLFDKCWALGNLAGIHISKGELDLALNYNKDFIVTAEKTNLKGMIANSLRQTATIYRLKGDLNQALEYFERSLMIIEKTGVLIGIPDIFTNLIDIYIEKGTFEKAKEYLKRLEQHTKKTKDERRKSYLNQLFNYNNAMILKSSSNIRDRLKAEILLKNILETEFSHKHVYNKTMVLAHLCDLLLNEFRLSGDLEILDEIRPLIAQFKIFAERQNTPWRLAEVHLLEAKMALMLTNMGDARRYLTEAQKIADDHGLGLLAQRISIEHDTLLEQFEVWEDLKERKASISERLNAVSIEDVMERILNKRAVEPSKVVDEQPVLLMVIAEGGVLLFSYSFSEEWKHDNELLGSFMSAFTSFSDEFFSEELDRVKFGQYTVLMKTIPNFSICYVFKGQSYLAKKKLTHFTNRIQNNHPVIQTLNEFYQKSQVIEIKDFPFFEIFITEIFTPTNQLTSNSIIH